MEGPLENGDDEPIDEELGPVDCEDAPIGGCAVVSDGIGEGTAWGIGFGGAIKPPPV